MKKTPLLIFCALLLCGSLHAKPVDANKARQVASAFLNRVNANEGKPFALTDITSQTPYTEFYVFTLGETGFILVSADDVAIPILGYSTTSRFVTKDMPENVAAWYEDYEREIRTLKEVLGSDNEPAPGWEIVENPTDLPRIDYDVNPLISTRWNQGNYYNGLCPTISGSHAPTGCVATATAQLMKFWNHPATGHGSHSYNHSSAGTLSANFGATTYDWSNMPISLTASSSNTQKTAVATLMYHIGVAVQMNYGSNSSGATTLNYPGRFSTSAQTALMKYFKYKSSMTSIRLENYTSARWRALLRAELDAGRPVLYSGRNTDGGHAFICDGYNNSNQFHFNWGWGGSHDGNFAIGSLNPGVGGIGGNASGTYNMDNAALIGVEPHSGTFGVGGTVSVSTTGCGGCSVSGAGAYNFGDTVTLLPVASECYRFAQWENGCNVAPRIFTPNGGNYNFTAQFERLDGDTLSYCGNQSQASAYRTSSSSSYWGIRLPASLLYNGTELQAVQLYVAEAGAHTFNAYTSNPTTSTPAATATVTFATSQVDSWQTITLATPLALNGTQDLWLTFEYSADPDAYPAAVCPSTGNSDGLLMYSSFIPRLDASRPYTFMIRGIFYRPPIPIVYDTATVPYYTGFETADDRGWEWVNATPNGWAIGNATSQSGGSAMYVSNDGGTTNAYTANQSCASFATRTFQLAAGQYNLAFNWKGSGESTWDFMRVFLCPASETPAASFFSSQALARTGVPSGWTDISGAYLNQRTDWQDTAYLFQVASSGYYKVVFMWFNDGSNSGTAAAVDNVNLEKVILPATVPYATGFEAADDCDWEYVNAGVNHWTIGSATSQSGSRALYISNDGGTGNAYTNNQSNTSFATRTVTLAAGQYTLGFNWKLKGETSYDFMRVFLCPANATPSAELLGSNTTARRTTVPTGWQDIAAGMLVNQTTWQTASYDFTVAAAGDYKLVFMWYNDHGDGDNPPAAIDNVQLAPQVQQYTLTVNANNASMGSVSGGGTYAAGATATLTATPAAGHHFVQWNDGNTQNPRTVTVTANATYTATFAVNSYTLTVNANDAAMGSTTGGGSYTHGQTATLTATASDGYHFVQWNDGNTQNPRTVTVTTNATYTATFEANPTVYYMLTVGSTSDAMGTVASTHSGSVEEGTTVTVTATPATGHHFEWWQTTGGTVSTANPYTFTLNGDMALLGHFAPNSYTITGTSNDNTMGYVTGGGSYTYGATVTLYANAYGGYHFVSWGDGATDNPRTDTVRGDATYTAIFEADPPVINYHSVTVECDAARGTVESTHTGSGVEEGTNVTVTAHSAAGYRFVCWTDAAGQQVSASNPYTFTLIQDVHLVAEFVPFTYTVTAAADNPNSGTVAGAGTYDYNTTATLTATAYEGHRFVAWHDGNTDNPRTVVVTSDSAFTAYFETVGIDAVAEDAVTLYPNPATTTVTLSGLTPGTEVQVVDMQGRTISEFRIKNSKFEADVSRYARGTYFVRIVGGENTSVRKLILK